jgi:hypothetical protein
MPSTAAGLLFSTVVDGPPDHDREMKTLADPMWH